MAKGITFSRLSYSLLKAQNANSLSGFHFKKFKFLSCYTLLPHYFMVRYSTISDTTWSSLGSQIIFQNHHGAWQTLEIKLFSPSASEIAIENTEFI